MAVRALAMLLYEDPRRTLLYESNFGGVEHRQRPIKTFGRLIVPILDRHRVPANHEARHDARVCEDGGTLVGACIASCRDAGVTPLEIAAVIELALREAYPDQPLPER